MKRRRTERCKTASGAPASIGPDTLRALWKFSWFLRDFGYAPELIGRDEVEEKGLIGLRGVVKLPHTVVNGRTLVNLEAFEPAGAWESISSPAPPPLRSELAS